MTQRDNVNARGLERHAATRADRRRFLAAAGLGGLFFAARGAFAEELTRTPRQTEGPFYPDRLPLDQDNDLLVINDAITPAVGEITHLNGRILDARGEPVRNAVVEIWQCDRNGVYLHSGSDNSDNRDVNFQGFGRFVTASTGEYRFRTIKPVPYPGRTPHIHFLVKVPGRDKFPTQCYVRGEPLNESDSVLKKITDPRERESVIVPFTPIAGSKTGELSVNFDVVLGFTPSA